MTTSEVASAVHYHSDLFDILRERGNGDMLHRVLIRLGFVPVIPVGKGQRFYEKDGVNLSTDDVGLVTVLTEGKAD